MAAQKPSFIGSLADHLGPAALANGTYRTMLGLFYFSLLIACPLQGLGHHVQDDGHTPLTAQRASPLCALLAVFAHGLCQCLPSAARPLRPCPKHPPQGHPGGVLHGQRGLEHPLLQ